MVQIKKYILFIILLLLSMNVIATTYTTNQLYDKWYQAQFRSKSLFNIALYLQKQVQFYSGQSQIKDSLIINLQMVTQEQSDIISLKTQQINNMTIINQNLQKELNKGNAGLSKELYFTIGLILGVVPPCLAIILLGGR